jgi:AcrR family transcriptional regulator
MGPVRRRLATDERRAEILEAALRVFAVRDMESVSVEELAREAGASGALVYHYFGSKRGLAEQALNLAADHLIADMSLETAADQHPLVQLDEGLGNYLDFLEGHPVSWSALLRAGAAGVEPGASIAQRVDDHAVAFSRAALRVSGPLPVLDQALYGWLDLVKGTCLRWLEAGRPERPQLHTLLAGCFLGAVQAAAGADPACESAVAALSL